MYCKTTYDAKTSTLNGEIFKCTAPYFLEDKENLYKTFHAKMQENHNPNCSGCPKCGKNSYVQPSSTQTNFCLNEEWFEHPLRENYCTDCSGKSRSRNVGNLYVNKDESGYCEVPVGMQDYVTVFNTRRTGRSTDSARGSMYGCDQICVEDVPLYKDVNNSRVKGTSDNQPQGKTSGCSKDKVENCSASETRSSKHSGKCRDDSDDKSHQVDPAKLGRMSRNEHTGSCGSYHNIDDVRCSENVISGSEFNRKTTAKDESKPSVKFTDSEKIKTNLGKDKSVDAEKDDSRRETFQQDDSSECYRKTSGKAESKSSQKFTDNVKVKSNFGKGKTMDPEKDNSKRADGGEKIQQEDTDKSKQPKNVKTEEDEAPKPAEHGGRDRSKVPRGSKRMPRRRVQRKPQAHVQAGRYSEEPANGGIDEWLLFVFDSIRQGIVSALSGIPSYLSIGWSLLVYFLLLLILLILPVFSCTWTLIKSCLVKLWDVIPYLQTCIRSIRNKVFKKQDENSHDTSEQQSRRPDTRQRSDPLPEADELVSKLLASKDLDAYEVIGVSPSATDEEIKRKYRDMAKVVHPDKNAHEDASEAFKILQSAFEAIGDEEKRKVYEFDNNKKRFEEEMDEFFENFMEKVQEMKNKIMCRVCQKSHPRVPTDRLIFAARYCSECGVRHTAREGDVWVETSHMGFKYYCFLCMDGQVYEVTDWGACQGLLRLRANSHNVFMSVKSNQHSPWDDMFGDGDRSGNNKKKRKSKGKSNKNKKRY